MPGPDLKEVTTGLRFPEGPVAMPDGSVLVVEIEAARLTRVAPDGRKTTVSQHTGGPNGAAVGPDGKVYICNNGGFNWHEDPKFGLRPTAQADDYSGGRIERVDLATGAIETVYTECDGFPLKGPNDIVFDAHGGFYFTDLGKTRPREMDRGAVYYAKADGSFIKAVAYPTITPNGCALSPDGRTLYFAETESARLWAMDILGPGEVRREPFPSINGGRLVGCPGGYQRFDSMAVDGAGNICVATLDQRRHHRVQPGRQKRKAHPDAGHLCDQHLLRRAGPPHGLRDALGIGPARGLRVGVPGPAAELPVI